MDINFMTSSSSWMTLSLQRWHADLMLPYLIILFNCLIFKLVRNCIHHRSPQSLLLLLTELVSTLELCAQCAELNIIYDLHGSWAYGITLCLVTIWWTNCFGEAHATPAYVIEDWLQQAEFQHVPRGIYSRLIGQAMAVPLASKFAALYWSQHLIDRHHHYDDLHTSGQCQTALTTSTLMGFLVEFTCCLLYRLLELTGQHSIDHNKTSNRWISHLVTLIDAAFGSALVVAALEHSGGYMNPMLASSLEYGCQGANNYQHFIVFWLGPLVGHICARKLHSRLTGITGITKSAATATATTTTTVTTSEVRTIRKHVNGLEQINRMTTRQAKPQTRYDQKRHQADNGKKQR